MLILLCHIENDAYGLDISKIIEVVPVVSLKKISHSPEFVAGFFNFRGTIIPVIDLSVLIRDIHSKLLLSTRIIVIDFFGEDRNYHKLGLLAEQVTETISCKKEDIKSLGMEIPNAPFLGDIVLKEQGMIQFIKLEKILSKDIQDMIFKKETFI